MADVKFSTGLIKAWFGRQPQGSNIVLTNTAEFTGNQILDVGKLGGFAAGDFVRVALGVNENVYAQVVSGDSDQLTFATDTFTSAAAGTYVLLERISTGSFAEVMQNGVIYLFGSPRRTSPDDDEGLAQVLAILTKGGGTFTPGESANGINLALSGASLIQAVDPATGEQEVVSGVGLVTGTASWGCWYDNDRVMGASTTAIRADAAASTSDAAFFKLDSQNITAGKTVTLTGINIVSSNQ